MYRYVRTLILVFKYIWNIFTSVEELLKIFQRHLCLQLKAILVFGIKLTNNTRHMYHKPITDRMAQTTRIA